MKLKEHYETLSEDKQQALDGIYMDDYIRAYSREEFDNFDHDTFNKVSAMWVEKVNNIAQKLNGLGLKIIIISLVSAVMGFLIKGWWIR